MGSSGNTTIITDAASGEANRYSGISATTGNTSVTVADGKTLNIEGTLEDIQGADRIYLVSSRPGASLDITGDINGTLKTASNASIRGVRAYGDTRIDGKFNLVVNGGSGDIVGAEAWEGGHLQFAGESTDITVNSTGGRVIGVQNHTSNGAIIDFNAAQTTISVDNSSGSGTYSQGVLAYQSTTNFTGNATIAVKGNTAETYGVDVQCDPGNKFDTVVNFSGSETKIVVSAKNHVFGVRPSGVPGEINFTGESASVEVESEKGVAAGVWTQYGGHANFAADASIKAVTHGSGAAYGVRVTNYANYAGNATFEKSLTITATADEASAYGILNDSHSKEAGSSTDDGILSVAGSTVITVFSKSNQAAGIAASGDLAQVTLGSVAVQASSESGTALGIAANNSGIVALNGDVNTIAASGASSVGLAAQKSGQIIMSGTTTAAGELAGVMIDADSSMTLKEEAVLSTNTMSSEGTINLADRSLLAVAGEVGGSSELGTIAADGATVALGAGKFAVDSLNGTGNTLYLSNLKSTDSVDINSASSLTVAASGSSNDGYANGLEAFNALKTKVVVAEGTDNVYVVEEGTVNDGIAAAQNEDGTWTTTTRANQKLVGFSSVNALSVLAWRHEINSLSKRMGELRDSPSGIGSWVRLYGSEQEYGARSITNKSTTIQAGADVSLGDWKLGLAGSYTDGKASYGLGEADTDNYGIALYGTWLIPCGAYVDLIARYNRLDNDFDLNGMNGSYNNNAWSFNAEAGYKFSFAEERFFVEPQAGLSYGLVEGASFRTENGVQVDQDDFKTFIGRAGLRAGMSFPEKKGTIYARASVVHDFEGDLDTAYRYGAVSRNATHDDLGGTWMEYGLGANFNLTEGTYIYADLERNDGGRVKENWRWNIGLRHTW